MFDAGRRFFVEGLMLVCAPGHQAHARLGILVNRKRGKAHDRNAFRRRAKAWFWRKREHLAAARDFVLVATAPVKGLPRQTLYDRLESLFRKSGALASP